MPGNCQIRLHDSFGASLENILLAPGRFPHGRQGSHLQKKFLDFVLGEIQRRISENPRQFSEEPWPEGIERPPGWTFRKLRTVYPRFEREARLVRLIFLLSPSEDEAILLLVYTHAEFPGRPPEDDLSSLLRRFLTER